MKTYKIKCHNNILGYITEADVNIIKFKTIYSSEWFMINKDKEGYTVYGLICGDRPTFVCKGSYVQTWKTLNNIKKAIKNFIINGDWGFSSKFPKQHEI